MSQFLRVLGTIFQFLKRFLRAVRRRVFNYGVLKFCALALVWILVIGSIVFLSSFLYYQRTIPDPTSIATRRVKESTKIYDRSGTTLLYDIHGEEKRTIIPWEQISGHIKNATLASEDGSFYEHSGFDLSGIVRALVQDVASLDRSQGGSTITQQLVKNALLGQEKTLGRKMKELILSIEIERRFSKDQIFWMYLNQIPYGSNAYGVQAASQTFFGKNAADVSISEAATLAALIQAPSYYSPYGSHLKDLIARRNNVLVKMRDLGHITQEEYDAAIEAPPEFKPFQDKFAAPHFVVMVKEYLSEKYGDDALESGGLKITTTLDTNLQTIAETTVAKYVKINREKYKASNAALVSIDPKTGEVLALVGSADYFDTTYEGNFNVATALRQPGSSFKPFAYSALINKGFTDSSVLFDVLTEFNPQCNPNGQQQRDIYGLACYNPQNYDGNFRGPVTLRQALAQSLNIPAVKTLYLAGIDETVELATKMGITTLKEQKAGLSLVLGGAEVRLIDLTSAYAVFANDGVRNPWTLIQKVELPNGTVLEERKDESDRVLDAQTSRMITNILSDNAARAPVFGYSSPLYFPGRDVAAKTGTTQNNRDAWVEGYTPSLVTGVWTGNNDNTPMTRAGGGISAAGPMWNEYMRLALANMPRESFIHPDPVSVNKIMIDGNYVYRRDGESSPEYHSILFYVDRNNPLGDFPANPYSDPQFSNWEWAVNAHFVPPPLPTDVPESPGASTSNDGGF